MRKVFGYLFVGLASLFSLGLVVQFSNFTKSFFMFFKSIVGKATPYEQGYALGGIIAYVITLAIAIVLWLFGLKWIKNK